MTADATIGVEIDPSGAVSGGNVVKRSLAEIDSASDSAKAAILGIGGAARSIAGAIATAFSFRQIIQDTVEAGNVQARLQSVIRATGGAAGITRDELNEMAKSYQQLTTFSDEQVNSAQAVLLRFTNIGRDVFPRAQQAVIDMAAAFDGDLQSAAFAVGKALENPAENLGLLSRQLGTVDDATKKTIKSLMDAGRQGEAISIVLDLIQDSSKGAAAEVRNTLGGALTEMQNQMGELTEAADGGNGLRQAIESVTAVISQPAFQQGFQTFAANATTALGAVIQGSLFAANRIYTGFEFLFNFLGENLGAIAAQSVIFFQTIPNILETAFLDAKGFMLSVISDIHGIASNALLNLAGIADYIPGADGVAASLRSAAAGAEEFESENRTASNAARTQANQLRDAYDSLVRQMEAVGEAADENSAEILRNAAASMENFDAVVDAATAIDLSIGADGRKKNSLSSLGESIEEQNKRLKENAELLKRNAADLITLIEKIDPGAAAVNRFTEGMRLLSAFGPPDPVKVDMFIASFRDGIEPVDAATRAVREFEASMAQLEALRATDFFGPEGTEAADAQFASMAEAFKQRYRDALAAIQEAAASAGDAINNSMRMDSLSESLDEIKGTLTSLSSEYGAASAQVVGGLELIIKAQNDVSEASKKGGKELSDAMKKSSADTIRGYAQMAGGAASFFKEGSSGYKAMTALSKAFYAIELSMAIATALEKIGLLGAVTAAKVTSDTVQASSDTAKTGVIQSNNLLETASGAVTAVVNAIKSLPFPFNIAAGAATIAFLGSIGAKIAGGGGGSGAAAAPRPTGDANMGTGTVLGDVTKGSESLMKGLETLEQHASTGLTYSALMLRQLQEINAGINGVGLLLIKSNVATGGATPFNYGSSGPSSSAQRVMNFNDRILPGLSSIDGGALGRATSSFFGRTQVSQLSSGLAFNAAQSIGDIMSEGIEAAYFAVIQTTTRRLHGAIRRTRTRTEFADAGDEIESQFSQIVTNLSDSVFAGIRNLGGNMDEARTLLSEMTLGFDRINLQGLSPEDVQKRLAEVFSALADRMASAASGALAGVDITDFQRVGEGLYETLLRLASQVIAVEGVFRDLGITLEDVDPSAIIGIADSLIEMAGGVENFSSNIDDFTRGFYSDAERTVMQGDRLRRMFQELGVQFPMTRQGFREMVEGLNVTTEAGQQMFTLLTSMSGDVAEYFDAVEQASDSLRDSLESLADSLEQAIEGVFLETQSPQQNLDFLLNKFDVAYALALSSSGTELERQADLINGLIDPIFEQIRLVYASGPQAQELIDYLIRSTQSVIARLRSRNSEFEGEQGAEMGGSGEAGEPSGPNGPSQQEPQNISPPDAQAYYQDSLAELMQANRHLAAQVALQQDAFMRTLERLEAIEKSLKSIEQNRSLEAQDA